MTGRGKLKPQKRSNSSKTIGNTSTCKTTKSASNNSENKENLDKYNSLAFIESLCERVMSYDRTGIYTPEPASLPVKKPCQFKKPKLQQSNTVDPNSEDKEKKTTFGKGLVGRGHGSYGVKHCRCCNPPNSLSNFLPKSLPNHTGPPQQFNITEMPNSDKNDYTSNNNDHAYNKNSFPAINLNEPIPSTSKAYPIDNNMLNYDIIVDSSVTDIMREVITEKISTEQLNEVGKPFVTVCQVKSFFESPNLSKSLDTVIASNRKNQEIGGNKEINQIKDKVKPKKMSRIDRIFYEHKIKEVTNDVHEILNRTASLVKLEPVPSTSKTDQKTEESDKEYDPDCSVKSKLDDDDQQKIKDMEKQFLNMLEDDLFERPEFILDEPNESVETRKPINNSSSPGVKSIVPDNSSGSSGVKPIVSSNTSSSSDVKPIVPVNSSSSSGVKPIVRTKTSSSGVKSILRNNTSFSSGIKSVLRNKTSSSNGVKPIVKTNTSSTSGVKPIVRTNTSSSSGVKPIVRTKTGSSGVKSILRNKTSSSSGVESTLRTNTSSSSSVKRNISTSTSTSSSGGKPIVRFNTSVEQIVPSNTSSSSGVEPIESTITSSSSGVKPIVSTITSASGVEPIESTITSSSSARRETDSFAAMDLRNESRSTLLCKLLSSQRSSKNSLIEAGIRPSVTANLGLLDNRPHVTANSNIPFDIGRYITDNSNIPFDRPHITPDSDTRSIDDSSSQTPNVSVTININSPRVTRSTSARNSLVTINLLDDTVDNNTIETIEITDSSSYSDPAEVIELDDSAFSPFTPRVTSPVKKSNSVGLGDCPICLEELGNEIMSTICGHIYCSMCIKNCIKATKRCPKCRKMLTLKSIHPLFF